MSKEAEHKIRQRFKFQEGERVLCFHGPLIYEAKCLKTRKNENGVMEYYIHYAGWNKGWDEWINDDRIMKYNDANVAKQRDLLRAYKDVRKIKNKCMAGAGPESLKTNTDQASSDSQSSEVSKRIVPEANEISVLWESDNETDDSAFTRKRRRSQLQSDVGVESEEQFLEKVEIEIKMLDELKPWLVDDWDIICRQKKLLILPAKVTVDQIINDYIKSKSSSSKTATTSTEQKNSSSSIKESIAVEVATNIKDYFNSTVGSQLLYKYERLQHSEILEKYPCKQMSSIYGAAHLLRLFVIIGRMIVYTSIDEKTIHLLQIHIHDFLEHLSNNISTYFSLQYYTNMTADYHRRVVLS